MSPRLAAPLRSAATVIAGLREELERVECAIWRLECRSFYASIPELNRHWWNLKARRGELCERLANMGCER